MNNVKQQTCALLACAAVLMAPLRAHGADIVVAGQGAFEASEAPTPGSVLMLAAGLMVAGCMRRREHGLGDFEE